MKWLVAYKQVAQFVDMNERIETRVVECESYPTWEDLKCLHTEQYERPKSLISISPHPEHKKEANV